MKKSIRKLIIMVVVFCLGLIPITANATSNDNSSKDGEITGCTVRTFLRDTAGYETSNSTEVICNIIDDKRLEVLQEENSRFLVQYGEQMLWIESTDVLVNIAEYIPTLDIRLDMAQEKNYFSITGKDIKGLTDRTFYTLKESKKAAWLKYEPAKKLLDAEEKFLEDGYCIVIYDAYRPYTVTVEFQRAFSNFLSTQDSQFVKYSFGELGEGWFLAQNASAHNFGVAVDMSLKKISNNKLLVMPSRIHTLDKRSAIYYWENNKCNATKNAMYMKQVMENSGFTYLKSEWWHFQDNTVKRDIIIDVEN